MSKLKKAGILFAILIAGAASWFYFYWMNTPAYAAGEIQKAVQSHDYDLLAYRVDLNKVYSAAIDDSADVLSKDGEKDHRTAASLLRSLKNPIADELVHQTQLRFQGKKKESSLFDEPVNAITSYLGFTTLTITQCLSIEEKGDQAIVSVRVHDRKLKHDFTWKVLMEKDVNGTWCATRILNLKDYIREREALL
ncbi:hypothetical protein [Allisonella histaminiformans]|uniref:hypothetical protein n=1 Tax=Allisonella histaminiformans TaxID=209880 RepID=UPI0026EABD3F|nr:hypothetical protein [Allisonella histaminiformans]